MIMDPPRAPGFCGGGQTPNAYNQGGGGGGGAGGRTPGWGNAGRTPNPYIDNRPSTAVRRHSPQTPVPRIRVRDVGRRERRTRPHGHRAGATLVVRRTRTSTTVHRQPSIDSRTSTTVHRQPYIDSRTPAWSANFHTSNPCADIQSIHPRRQDSSVEFFLAYTQFLCQRGEQWRRVT